MYQLQLRVHFAGSDGGAESAVAWLVEDAADRIKPLADLATDVLEIDEENGSALVVFSSHALTDLYSIIYSYVADDLEFDLELLKELVQRVTEV